MQRAAKTGAWLAVLPSTVNGTELRAQEWRDALFLRYGLEPPDLPKYCDRCKARFSISHALDCKKGGLVMERHFDRGQVVFRTDDHLACLQGGRLDDQDYTVDRKSVV